MKRLVLTEIARADLASIRRFSTRSWGPDQTSRYFDALRDTMKGLVRGTVATRARDDLRPGILMATSGRHSIFFEADGSRILV
ncbi:MAG: type II toxin-antitoxin system RelE/ParE family toxin, partial [Vicinamibacterales bacterium]